MSVQGRGGPAASASGVSVASSLGTSTGTAGAPQPGQASAAAASSASPRRRLCLVVEGNAALGPHWPLLRSAYINPLLSSFVSLSSRGIDAAGNTVGEAELSLLLYYTSNEFSGEASLAEALAEVLPVPLARPRVPVSSNLLDAPSDNASDVGCALGGSCFWWTADALMVAALFHHCGISLSLFSPRRVSVFEEIFQAALGKPKGEPVAQAAIKTNNHYPQHLLLLSPLLPAGAKAAQAAKLAALGQAQQLAVKQQQQQLPGATILQKEMQLPPAAAATLNGGVVGQQQSAPTYTLQQQAAAMRGASQVARPGVVVPTTTTTTAAGKTTTTTSPPSVLLSGMAGMQGNSGVPGQVLPGAMQSRQQQQQAAQPQGSSPQLVGPLWEGMLAYSSKGVTVDICHLQAYHRKKEGADASSNAMPLNWPMHLLISRLTSQDMIHQKEHRARSEIYVLTATQMQQQGHNFLLQLATRKLAGFVDLTTHVLVLAVVPEARTGSGSIKLIGMLCPKTPSSSSSRSRPTQPPPQQQAGGGIVSSSQISGLSDSGLSSFM
eukprot:jgi/Chlat1/1554/Chrsp122S08666